MKSWIIYLSFIVMVQNHCSSQLSWSFGTAVQMRPDTHKWVKVTLLSENRGLCVIRVAVDMEQLKAHTMQASLVVDRRKAKGLPLPAIACNLKITEQGGTDWVDVTIARDLIPESSVNMEIDALPYRINCVPLAKWLDAHTATH